MLSHKVLSALSITIVLAACVKDSPEVLQDTGVLPSTCGHDGARVQASVDGSSSYCASAQVLATGDSSSVVVTGVDLTGNTLILQLDSLVTGTQAITVASNGLLYLRTGNTFVIMPGAPGTLTVTQVDTAAHTLKAGFDAHVTNELNGASHHLQGSVDVVWTVGQ